MIPLLNVDEKEKNKLLEYELIKKNESKEIKELKLQSKGWTNKKKKKIINFYYFNCKINYFHIKKILY